MLNRYLHVSFINSREQKDLQDLRGEHVSKHLVNSILCHFWKMKWNGFTLISLFFRREVVACKENQVTR